MNASEVESRASQAAIRHHRREAWWAWASLLVLIVAWDAAGRLDQQVSLPRTRMAHAVEESARMTRADAGSRLRQGAGARSVRRR